VWVGRVGYATLPYPTLAQEACAAAHAHLSAWMKGSTMKSAGGAVGMGTRPRGCGVLSTPSGMAPARATSARAYAARSAAESMRATPAPSPSATGFTHRELPPAHNKLTFSWSGTTPGVALPRCFSACAILDMLPNGPP